MVLGGSHDEGDWNTDVCQETKARIFRDCCKILPSLRVSKKVRKLSLTVLEGLVENYHNFYHNTIILLFFKSKTEKT